MPGVGRRYRRPVNDAVHCCGVMLSADNPTQSRGTAEASTKFSFRAHEDVAVAGDRQANAEVQGTFNAVRNSARAYTFFGNTSPQRAGEPINIYRVVGGLPVLVSRTAARADGSWTVDRTFSGTGTFPFFAVTGGDGINRTGQSPVIVLTVH